MRNVVIADSSKPSVVIISEILKDNFEEIAIHVYNNAKEVFEFIKNNPCDLLVTEFFLTDLDGVSLAKKIKKVKNVPIIFTTFYNEDFFHMYEDELFTYGDCYEVQLKPINQANFKVLAERYLSSKGRMSRRFEGDQSVQIVSKPNKKTKKKDIIANLKNISLEGFCLSGIDSGIIENESIQFKLTTLKDEIKTKSTSKQKTLELAINGEVKWVNKEKHEIGGVLKVNSKGEKEDLLKFFKKLSMNTKVQENVT